MASEPDKEIESSAAKPKTLLVDAAEVLDILAEIPDIPKKLEILSNDIQ